MLVGSARVVETPFLASVVETDGCCDPAVVVVLAGVTVGAALTTATRPAKQLWKATGVVETGIFAATVVAELIGPAVRRGGSGTVSARLAGVAFSQRATQAITAEVVLGAVVSIVAGVAGLTVLALVVRSADRRRRGAMLRI